MNKEQLLSKSPAQLIAEFPFLSTFFAGQTISFEKQSNTCLAEILQAIDEEKMEDNAFDASSFLQQLADFIEQMEQFLGKDAFRVDSLTILPGTNKLGDTEQFQELIFRKRTITSIVGPTGSGKSRLLADIEWVAQADTPTNRTVLVNDKKPGTEWRFSGAKKLVAQLSQNMNFVMDLQVDEFLLLHARSRMIKDPEKIIDRIIDAANELAGEKFEATTPITSLSGGQSRALMIADTAMLSSSPVVLIDEIENAGIDRKKALKLLTGEDKIVLMATHDPILALMADQRIVIKNGGIHKVIKTSDEEKKMLVALEEADQKLQHLRTLLRQGEIINIENYNR
jgi:ABC-type lipoprotein export system ATPase subunit